jgi:hypothetical protein
VLVDAQQLGAFAAMPFPELAPQAMLKVALYGGDTDPLAPSQAAAVDPVQVNLKNHFLKGLTGSLARQNTGKALVEVFSAFLALPLGRLQAPGWRDPTFHASPVVGAFPCCVTGCGHSAGTFSVLDSAPRFSLPRHQTESR